MERKENENYYTIDVLHILKALWHRLWALVLAGIIAGGIGFSIAAFLIAPKYSSSVMLYVNSTDLSVGGTSISISPSQITAAQELVNTYIVFIQNRTTLEMVIEDAGVDYNYKEVWKMIEAAPVNDTEVFRVTVTCEDPYDAAKIANSISAVLSERIEIIEGSSMKVVDSAIVDPQKVSPSITKFTAIGIILGVLIVAGVIAVFAILDDTIHDEEYILRTYDYPILAKVPNLVGGSGSYKYKYNYYSRRYKYQQYQAYAKDKEDG